MFGEHLDEGMTEELRNVVFLEIDFQARVRLKRLELFELEEVS